MHTWAKRGIQTALFTGGLLMLGTGIASADENVSPDTPAGPLDVNLSVPVDISKNAVGTLGKQVDIPAIKKEISTKPLTDKLNGVLAPITGSGVGRAASPVTGAVNGLAAKAAGAAGQAGDRLGPVTGQGVATENREAPCEAGGPSNDPLMGNKAVGNIAVPIQITGNAIGLLGNAEVESDSTQTYTHNTEIATNGAGGGLAGNAVALDWALPVQIAGNGVGVAGRGKSKGSASQSAATTGNVATSGANGAFAGNVISPQGATPVQISGNAIGGPLGHGETGFNGASEASSGGWISTHGSHGAVAGNVLGTPVALPLKVSNNAVAGGGDADVCGGSSTADATAGGTRPGTPTYIQTDGADSFLAGNIAQPQPALPGTVVGNAIAAVGNAAVSGGDTGQIGLGGTATAGGVSSTTGENAVGSGNIADAPVAAPVEVFCGVGTLVGNSHAKGCANDVTAGAGGNTYTNGNGGFLAGNSANAQPAGTAELFGLAGAVAGNGSSAATENKNVHAGGYNGSLGNDSSGSGNVVQVPVAVPAEIFGAGGALAGQAGATASETKTVSGGGGGNTQDDHGSISANLVQVPASLPVQVFGVGAAGVGQGSGEATTNTTSTAGGTGNANGKEGFAAGNIGALPVSLPVQLHGLGAAAAGNGFGESEGLTDSGAGGHLSATGEGGSIAGNIVGVPAASAAQVFGDGVVLGGLGKGHAVNDLTSVAGGSAETNGDGGSIAGNLVNVPVTPLAQVFGDAISVPGVAQGAGANNTQTAAGGESTTSGIGGSISGNLFDVPTAAVAQVFGDAVSVGGVANAIADNTTNANVGGTGTSSGATGSLSGTTNRLPIGVVAQVYDIPAEILAETTSTFANNTAVSTGGEEPGINLPVTSSELLPTGLPSLPNAPQTLPIGAPARRADLPGAGTLPVQLTGPGVAPSLPTLPVDGLLPQAGLPLNGLPLNGLPLDGLPQAGQAGLPLNGLPQAGQAGLPLDGLPLNGLPLDGLFTGQLLPSATDLLPGQGMHIQG
ncbi:MAG TPA: hypothetical protein VJT49_27690 [Amycolatopsis sp.]|uniref:beta strand repeat-containing protein n=1 Tax=Amycolatopsis sp. TaxID=37632 RepID=UPI002B496938|nr:hypothetical protein [Amycolatopsis sp.]HKS48824.1 hypothetical protein [Amycolatopsis sp.]